MTDQNLVLTSVFLTIDRDGIINDIIRILPLLSVISVFCT